MVVVNYYFFAQITYLNLFMKIFFGAKTWFDISSLLIKLISNQQDYLFILQRLSQAHLLFNKIYNTTQIYSFLNGFVYLLLALRAFDLCFTWFVCRGSISQ